MKSLIVNVSVENCKQALAYYQGIFGGEIKNVQLADGQEMFKGHEGKCIHSELHFNENCILYLTDIFSPNETIGTNYQLVLEMNGEEEIVRVFEALKKDGDVKFPLQDTFWGAKHGVITDPYKVTWGLNYTKA